jgi:hypothetical protein
MSEALQIPDNLQMTFKRMLHRLPASKRNNIDLQKSILLFLELGGERLARARMKLILAPFPENLSVVKLRPQPIVAEAIDADEDDSLDDDEDSEEDEKDDESLDDDEDSEEGD